MNRKTLYFPSMDGVKLFGVYERPKSKSRGVALLVHGMTVDHSEVGFFDLVVEKLLGNGYSCFRLDWRGHGKSWGKTEDVTLTGIQSDIHAAALKALELTKNKKLHLIGASFGGGNSAWFASKHPGLIKSVILVNPVIDYPRLTLHSKPYWDSKRNCLKRLAQLTLAKKGYIQMPGRKFKLGKALFRELLYLKPHEDFKTLKPPVLTVHGTKDKAVPYDIAKKFSGYNSQSRFLSVKDCSHGIWHFTGPGEKSDKLRSAVAEKMAEWITNNTR